MVFKFERNQIVRSIFLHNAVTLVESLARISYFYSFKVPRDEKGFLKKKVGTRHCFVNYGVLSLCCWYSAISLGKSILLCKFIMTLRQVLSSEDVINEFLLSGDLIKLFYARKRYVERVRVAWVCSQFLLTRLKLSF